jgi:lysophospholipase L1-like esterase
LAAVCPSPLSVVSQTGAAMSVHYGTVTSTGGTSPVQIACTPQNDSVFQIGSTTVTCTATDAKNVTANCSFSVTVTAPPKLNATSFIAFGDSMTDGEITDPTALTTSSLKPLVVVRAQSYPTDLLNELMARYTSQSINVFNGGKSGESILHDDPVSRLNGYLSGGLYQVLLLMEGANDINSRDTNSIAPAVAVMDSMVRLAKGRGMRVFLATLPPQNPLGSRGQGAVLVQPYNDALRSMAASENITLVDVYQAFGGDITTLIGSDGLHPTTAGYQRIADTFFAAIKQSLELPSPTASKTSAPLTAPTAAAPARRR